MTSNDIILHTLGAKEERAVISEAWGPPVNCRILLDLLQPPASKPENHHNKL